MSSHAGTDIKTHGFSLQTCMTMVHLMDVSFHLPNEQEAGQVQQVNQSLLLLPLIFNS